MQNNSLHFGRMSAKGVLSTLRAHTPKPQGFQPFAKSQWGMPTIFRPGVVPHLSRALSRWSCWRFNGLGGLSRCPAIFSFPYMYTHPRTRKCECSGTAGRRDSSSFFFFLSNKNRWIEKERAVPLMSRLALPAGQRLKTELNMGVIFHA